MRVLVLVCCLCLVCACGERKAIDDVLPAVGADEVTEESIDWMDGDEDEAWRDDGAAHAAGLDGSVARGRMNEIVEQIAAFHAAHGRLPVTLGEIAEPRDPDDPRIVPDEVDRTPVDPWGQVYRYERHDDASYTLRCDGPDAESGTADDIVRSESVE